MLSQDKLRSLGYGLCLVWDGSRDRFQTIITTTHIDTFNHDWIKDSQVLAVKAGNISEVLLN